MSEDVKKKKDYCRKQWVRVYERLSTARFNGVFGQSKDLATGQPIISPQEEAILNELDAAHQFIENTGAFQYTECLRSISNALSKLQNVVDTLPWRQKIVCKYGGEIWTYLLSLLIIVVSLNIDGYYGKLSDVTGFPIIAIYAAVWGFVGGILRGLWWLWTNVNRGSYRVEWRIWFMSSPFLGGIFGGISYLLITSTLVIITDDQGTINNAEAVYFIAVFGGFNWEWFVSLMKSVAESIHKTETP